MIPALVQQSSRCIITKLLTTTTRAMRSARLQHKPLTASAQPFDTAQPALILLDESTATAELYDAQRKHPKPQAAANLVATESLGVATNTPKTPALMY